MQPSAIPSAQPSRTPSTQPSVQPSSSEPSAQPSSCQPSAQPSAQPTTTYNALEFSFPFSTGPLSQTRSAVLNSPISCVLALTSDSLRFTTCDRSVGEEGAGRYQGDTLLRLAHGTQRFATAADYADQKRIAFPELPNYDFVEVAQNNDACSTNEAGNTYRGSEIVYQVPAGSEGKYCVHMGCLGESSCSMTVAFYRNGIFETGSNFPTGNPTEQPLSANNSAQPTSQPSGHMSCPAGTRLSVSWSPTYGETRTCVDCPAGGFSKEGDAKCHKCSAGFFASAQSATCRPCAAGFYSLEGASECKECSPGTVSNTSASAVCHKCQPGYFASAQSSECNPCPAGFYSLEGASECKECSPGTVSNATAPRCTPCPFGMYSYPGSSQCLGCSSN